MVASPAQHDIESIGERIERHRGIEVERRDKAIDRIRIRNRIDDRARLDQRIAFKIHLRNQALYEARSENREMDMGRTPAIDVVAPGIGPGLHRSEKVSSFGVRKRAPAATEIRINGRKIGVLLVPIAAARIGLPKFDERIRNWPPALIKYTAVHDDALTDRITRLCVVADKIVVERAEIVVAEDGARHLRQRVL